MLEILPTIPRLHIALVIINSYQYVDKMTTILQRAFFLE